MEQARLLLADDSLTIQRVVNLTFADEGMEVITVGDGDAAIQEIASARPDIVLADVHMPGPSGLEICSLLRGVDETANIPVILLVGSFEQFDPAEAEKAGADAFVTKPFQSLRQLVDQVKQLLSNRQSAPVPVAGISSVEKATEVDTTDIDSLYEQSFAETIEMSPTIAAEVNGATFASDELDDEMIETSYTSENNPEREQNNTDFDQTIVSASTGHGAPVSYYEEPEPQEIAAMETEPLSIENTNFSSYEETLQMDAPTVATPVPPLQETVRSAQTAPTEELRVDPFATTTDAFDLDDIDLLDLTASQVEDRYTFGTPTQAVESGGGKQVVTISPELLDIIVQKVVEKLSEKY